MKMKQQAIEAHQRLQSLTEEGYRVIFIDEICVTKSTIPTHEYSPIRQPIEIDLRGFSNKTIAVLAGISAEKGVEFAFTYEKSVNIEKFFNFLKRLRQKCPFEKIALFMDRLSVHTSKKAQKKMEFYGIEPIYNSAYSPDFNPIENVFSIVKRRIKLERLRLFANDE